jgi:hypothetical protein
MSTGIAMTPASNSSVEQSMNALESLANAVTEGSGLWDTETLKKEEQFKPLQDILDKFTGTTSEILQNATQKDEYGKGVGLDIGAIFSGAAGAFMKLISSVESVSALLDPIGTILQAALDVLAPILNSLLAPLVGMLTIIGQTIGKVLTPILQLLEPVLLLLSYAFVFTYNYGILPFANALIWVANLLYNIMATVWNGIATAINFLLGWLGVHLQTLEARALNAGFLEAIDVNSLSAAGTSTINNSAGTSASYTSARPIYVNVEINTEVITGEGGGFRQLAIKMQNEIQDVLALGLA